MNEQATRYPLAWPVGWRRTPARLRKRAMFRSYNKDLSIAQALDRLSQQLALLGARDELLSTNLRVGLRGWPVNQPEPDDCGVAVYFRFKGKPMSLACDKWDRVADNIAALAAHIDALRRIDRYGVGSIEQAFGGYLELTTGKRSWWEVLGFASPDGVTRDDVEDAYRRLAKERHPDAGGSHDAFTELGAAKDDALAEIP
jgi:hypothetical protein